MGFKNCCYLKNKLYKIKKDFNVLRIFLINISRLVNIFSHAVKK